MQGVPSYSKRLKRALRYVAIRGALAAVRWLPPRLSGAIGALLGAVAARVALRQRALALDSLRTAFPDATPGERSDLVRRSFSHLGRTLLELTSVRGIDARVEEWISWPDDERRVLERALSRGRGVIFVSGHVGSWELLARRIALAGYPCQTIAKETTDARLTALIQEFRAEAGLRSIWRGQPGAARHMLKALKAGEILGLLIDQDTRVQSVFVPFFGRLAATPRAPAELALKTGAALLLGFCTRVRAGRYRLQLSEVPVEPGATVMSLTAKLSLGIEAAIREAPEQWVWMHRRWKTRPPPAPPAPSASEEPS